MFRQGRCILTVAAAAIFLPSPGRVLEAQEAPVSAEVPILLTSCGQSPGPTMVRLFLNRLGLEHELLEQATAQDLIDRREGGAPFKSVIILTGASLKGMGAAGTSIREELFRTEALIEEARNQGLTIIGAHVEGMDRRAQGAAAGDNSDEQSIDAVMPFADVLVVRADGNEDRRFTVLSQEHGIPLVLFEKNMEMGDAFGSLFQK
jgi:hypothetical protein